MQSELYFASASNAPLEIPLMRKYINVRKQRLEWIKHAVKNYEPEDRRCRHYPTEMSIQKHEKIIAKMEQQLADAIMKKRKSISNEHTY